MVKLKTPAELALMREAGRRLAAVMKILTAATKPGVSARALDGRARELITASGDKPSFLHYRPRGAPTPFPAALCVSPNDTIVHGIPTDQILQTGDLVGLDLGLNHQGWHADMAVTVLVPPRSNLKGVQGSISNPDARKLIAATEEALALAIKVARPGHTLGDIGFAVESVAKKYGLGLVRDLGGHGVGKRVHEEPEVANYGQRGTGLKLKPGMVLAIEPMFTLGSGAVDFLPDGYTVKTRDHSLAAHFEHTVAITENGAEILTNRLN